MFPAKIYIDRRDHLRHEIPSGLVLFPGNEDVPFNYPANTYSFRQDSSFLYFFGLDQPTLAAVIDIDNHADYLFGNDVDIDDIIWMGKQPTMKERSMQVGVHHSLTLKDLGEMIGKARKEGRKIHYLPPYRGETILWMEDLLGIHHSEIKKNSSEALIKAVIKLRMSKDELEIREISRMVDIAYMMHIAGMKMAKPGILEREIAGIVEGIALSHAGPVSFPVILSINGQTLHNHYHGNVLTEERMLVIDAGCESDLHYASDITRTVPVGGKFSQRQKEIYGIVWNTNMAAIQAVKPGVRFRDVHLLAARVITQGLKQAGFVKGDVDEAVNLGVHTLFFPHGLGHPLGLDVHDLEGMGENFVGYDEETKRSKEFGLAFLRFGRRLQKNFVMTIEPGIYFIPELIDIWKAENRFADFLNYGKIDQYKDFGGIRIEDDVLVTETGFRVLGKPIPKSVVEIEKVMGE